MVYLARLMLRNKRGKICKKKMSNCNTNSVNSKSAFLTYFQILFFKGSSVLLFGNTESKGSQTKIRIS